MASTMTATTDNQVCLGFIVSKRMSYTETSYIADEMGNERTNDSGKAYVYGSLTDAMWVAGTQLSTQWEVSTVYQEW